MTSGALTEAMQRLSIKPSEPSAPAQNRLVVEERFWKKLWKHQKVGVKWLASRFFEGSGAVLGDDMGLGKTVQVSVFVGALLREQVVERALVAAPKSVLPAWKAHLEQWGGLDGEPGDRAFEIEVIESSESEKVAAQLRRFEKRGGVCLVSHHSVHKVKAVRFEYVVVDEVHKAKNPSTLLCRQLRELPGIRLGLSGTIVQNKMDELWCVFDWATRGGLGDLHAFTEQYGEPITKACAKDASGSEAVQGEFRLEMLREVLGKVHLRRTKKDIAAKLTQKEELVVWLGLSPLQRKAYRAVLSRAANSGAKAGTPSFFKTLSQLSKTCDHLWLTAPADGITKTLAEHPAPADLFRASLPPPERDTHGTLASGSVKFAFLLHFLREEIAATGTAADGFAARALLFSQKTSVLDLLEHLLKYLRLPFVRIDGSSSGDARQRTVDRFNTDARLAVCLVTTRAGGVGLTLTGANRVVIYDGSWNPANDAQGVDRAFRIGQSKDVTVYRLMTCGTVEEYLYKRQVFKTELAGVTENENTVASADKYFAQAEINGLCAMNLSEARTAKELERRLAKKGAEGTFLAVQSAMAAQDYPGVMAVTNHGLVLQAVSSDESRDTLASEPKATNLCASFATLAVRKTKPATPVSESGGGKSPPEATLPTPCEPAAPPAALADRTNGAEPALPAHRKQRGSSPRGRAAGSRSSSASSSSSSSSSASRSSSGSDDGDENPLRAVVGGCAEVAGHTAKTTAYQNLPPERQSVVDETMQRAFAAGTASEARPLFCEAVAVLYLEHDPSSKLCRLQRALFPEVA
ncbi:Protein CHROMATIN REMODELING 24 [Diplonema papillatum]|nr:Protein CHROMATIN REMODELING 24 [Diplonema papillatum]